MNTLSLMLLVSSETRTAKQFGEVKVLVFLLSGRDKAEEFDEIRLDDVGNEAVHYWFVVRYYLEWSMRQVHCGP